MMFSTLVRISGARARRAAFLDMPAISMSSWAASIRAATVARHDGCRVIQTPCVGPDAQNPSAQSSDDLCRPGYGGSSAAHSESGITESEGALGTVGNRL